jgi:hypothetical protein
MAAAYLAGCQTQPLTAGWQQLVDHVHMSPPGALTDALGSPLMISLVRDSLKDDRDIAAFLLPEQSITREDVENRLLDHDISSAYERRAGQQRQVSVPRLRPIGPTRRLRSASARTPISLDG